MVLGFISLLLTFGQNYIARICIPVKVANTMLPCPVGTHVPYDDDHHRKLLSFQRRFLGGDSTAPACKPVSIFYTIVTLNYNYVISSVITLYFW